MNDVALNDSVLIRPSHTFRGSFRADKKIERPFSASRTISPDLVSTLLRRPVEYDPELAYVLSVAAGWSYADGKTLANQLKFYGFPGASVEEISVRNPAMYIIATGFLIRSECGRVGVLSFRGTEPTNIISWLTDADVNLRNFSGTGSVHRGFYTNLRCIWQEISHALSDAIGEPAASNGDKLNGKGERRPLEHLYITGHSLGAAMAVLAAAKIFKDEEARLREIVRGIYTFGQPAVGDKQFAEHYAKLFGDRLYRHEYNYDAVPRLPPATTGSFVHFGDVRVSFKETEGWETPATMGQQAKYIAVTVLSVLTSFVGRRLPMFGKVESKLCKYSIFDDHSPTRYIEASRSALLDD